MIDLERERRREARGPAREFLEARPPERLHITVTSAGELACGVERSQRELWESLLGRFSILPIDRDACWEYGRAFRYLNRNGMLIGATDLWIAATALAHGRASIKKSLARTAETIPSKHGE